jgi:predicted ABC-type ATPase
VTPSPVNRLRLFAGPNGSGKTTLVRQLAKEYSAQGLFHLHRFINADDILAQLLAPEGLSWVSLQTRLSWNRLRDSIIRGGRLRADHLFLAEANLKRGG